MPQVRKLPPEEVSTIENKGKGQRKLTEEEYDRIIADFNEGDYGELTLVAGENRLTVRNRLKAAAKRKGVPLTFMRTRGEEIRFKVAEQNGNGHPSARPQAERRERDSEDEPTPVVPSLDTPTPKKRGGRPKKNG
jgi:hypothetical protein